MKLVDSTITKEELHQMATRSFGNLVKAVVDARAPIKEIKQEE